MTVHKITKGLDLPISGQPIQVIRGDETCSQVAVVADDFPSMKPRMRIQEGDTVKRGQVLFEDRKTAGVLHTAPGAGTVKAIHRGEKRALLSIVIELSDGEKTGEPGDDELQRFESYTGKGADALTRDEIRDLLVESGLWTAIRTRPYSKVPAPATEPTALFVTAMDTAPLAPLPEVVLADQRDEFNAGLAILAKLAPKTFLCIDSHSDLGDQAPPSVQVEHFEGPHPSGLVGLHIHLLAPVTREKVAWHIGYQDVVAVARLFATGKLDVSRVISIAGPPVAEPRLVRTRLGASIDELTEKDRQVDVELRTISGSVLSGKKAGGEIFGFLGRYERQVSVLVEDREHVFMGWLSPGANLFSVTNIYVSKLLALFGVDKKFDLTTSINGSHRAMVPIGLYEKVMPMDILPTFLLRAMMVGDVEKAEALGALELDEEDLALCTFVCPGKINYGPILRQNLEILEREG